MEERLVVIEGFGRERKWVDSFWFHAEKHGFKKCSYLMHGTVHRNY
jgi:hypothetical protein